MRLLLLRKTVSHRALAFAVEVSVAFAFTAVRFDFSPNCGDRNRGAPVILLLLQ